LLAPRLDFQFAAQFSKVKRFLLGCFALFWLYCWVVFCQPRRGVKFAFEFARFQRFSTQVAIKTIGMSHEMVGKSRITTTASQSQRMTNEGNEQHQQHKPQRQKKIWLKKSIYKCNREKINQTRSVKVISLNLHEEPKVEHLEMGTDMLNLGDM